MIYFLDLFGTAVFAITGSLAAGKKRMDLFGVIVLALVTAIGGGTLRDLILQTDRVFWIADPTYIYVSAAAAILTFLLARRHVIPTRMFLVPDAFGLAIFTVIGAQKALALGISPAIAVIMGMMTGVVGGMMRDVLSGEIPLILRGEIYATASFAGGVVFAALMRLWPNEPLNIFLSVIVILSLRLAAIHWKVSLPVFIYEENKPS